MLIWRHLEGDIELRSGFYTWMRDSKNDEIQEIGFFIQFQTKVFLIKN